MEIESSMAFRLGNLSHFIYLRWSVCYKIVFSTLKTCKPGHGSAFLCEPQKWDCDWSKQCSFVSVMATLCHIKC